MNGAAPAGHWVHANALLVGEAGLLLRGPSGAGKSALTLDLLQRAEARGDFAALVGDDRIDLCARNGRLVARGHPTIAGALEVRGLGVLRLPYEGAAVIRAVIDILDPAEPFPDRLPDEAAQETVLCGVTLPRIVVSGRDIFAAAKIIQFIHMLVAK